MKINKEMLADEEVAVEILSAVEFLDATSKFGEKAAGRKRRKKAKRAVDYIKSAKKAACAVSNTFKKHQMKQRSWQKYQRQ